MKDLNGYGGWFCRSQLPRTVWRQRGSDSRALVWPEDPMVFKYELGYVCTVIFICMHIDIERHA